jgi:hypothetical protein
MPIRRDLQLDIAVDDISLTRHSARARPLSAAVRTRLAELLTTVTEQRWLQPAIGYQIRPIAQRGRDWIELDCGTRLRSPLVAHRMRSASHLALVVCTVGERLSSHATAWFGTGNPARAVLLDEIGSIALYRLVERCGALLREEATTLALELSGSLSPGDDGFDIGEQTSVLRLAGGAELGVTVQRSLVLAPHKSLTAVYGLGKSMPSWTEGDNCGRCRARERCTYRRAAEIAA